MVKVLLSRAQRAEHGVYAPLMFGKITEACQLRLTGQWDDVEFVPDHLQLSPTQTITAKVEVGADAPLSLRFCFIGKDGSEADLWKEYQPGSTTFSFPVRDLSSRVGMIFATG